MQFGLEKCAYVYIERGKRNQLGENITVNNIAIEELKQDDTYKYLGQDEAVTYNGPINKERVSTEYLRRLRKVWNSQLNASNKTIAHNVFAVPVLTPTIGILDWSKEEVQQLDIKTRKTMAMAGSLHKRSDVERLYTPRKQGGRGLTSVEDIFTSRTVSLATHIENNKDRNPFLQKVCEHELQLRLFRVANEFKQYLEVQRQQLAPEQVGQEIRKALRSNHEKNWTDKVTHGYNRKIVKEDSKVNQSLSVKWIHNFTLTSHMEAYMFAIEEQEIVTKATKKRREPDITKRRTMDSKCRMCGKQEETLTHILASCESISESLYVKYRHSQVGKIVYQEFLENNGVKNQAPTWKPKEVMKTGDLELWWDKKIHVINKEEHNRPDLIIWDRKKKECKIIDFSVPLDGNVTRKKIEKVNNYVPLVNELQQMYRNYTYKIIPVVIGTLGTVSLSLKEHLKAVGITSDITMFVHRLQNAAIVGSVKTVKTVLKMRP